MVASTRTALLVTRWRGHATRCCNYGEQVSPTSRPSASTTYDHQMAMLHHRVEGSGPVVVLLHAGVADLRMWDTQVDALPGRKVVRCDLPGYGGTPVGPDTDGCDAEDVLDLLDRLGVAGFALVGASYGGYVALQVASAVPHRVERLVLLDTAANVVEPDDSLPRLATRAVPDPDRRSRRCDRPDGRHLARSRCGRRPPGVAPSHAAPCLRAAGRGG